MVSRNRKIARRIGQAVANDVLDISGAISAGAGVTVYATADDLPTTGLTAGDEAFVSGSNRLYISNGTGWYSIGLVNTNPAITSVEDPSSNTTPFTLATDGSALVLTITAADPEGFPLTYNHAVTTGSLTNGGGTTATVAQGTGEGYAIASASLLSGTHTVTANVGALTFKPDGTEMYYVGTHNDRVSRHTLSTAWDVSTASFVGSSPNTLSQVSNLTDVKFNNNGTKMYMADKAGTTDNTIYQYSLSTAWDPDTATYDNKSYDFSSVLTGDDLNCFVFNADGTAVYLAEHSPSSNIYQFTLSTAFDISTASYASKTLSLSSVASNGSVGRQYFQFTNDGSKLFLIHTFHPSGFVGKIYEYSLTTAYDISTASHTSVTYTPTGITTGRSAIAFKPDGSKMFIMGTDNHAAISQFNLPVYNANQFIITPTTTEAYAGTFELTFTTSDGINQASSVNSFTLEFITVIANSRYTTLLATATGTSDNNNITDASTNNHTITVNGDAHAGTFSPYRSGGYSTKFLASSSNYVRASSVPTLGNGAWTVECWVYFYDVPTTNKHIFGQNNWTGNSAHWAFFADYQKQIRFSYGSGAISVSNNVIADKTWHHICATKDTNGLITLYVDGASVGTATGNTNNFTYDNMMIGGNSNGQYSNVKIRDCRMVVGSVITPPVGGPTEPLTAVTNTVFLALHKPYMSYDTNSTTDNVFTTINGDIFIEAFSPYDYDEYDAANNGGSINFDGTGDYLDTNSAVNLSSGGCIEGWVYITSATNYAFFIASTQGAGNFVPRWHVGHSPSTDWRCSPGDATANDITGYDLITNQWNHFVLSNDGSTSRLFTNGVLIFTKSVTPLNEDLTFTLSKYGPTAQYLMTGNLSDVRVTTSIPTEYQTSSTTVGASIFTPPTEPLSSSGASLHIKGTDASIIDKSQGTNLKLEGNTTGSTTQAKFASTKSMYFDGTGDYAQLPVGSLHLGSSDFTIETWIYQDTNAGSGGSSHTIYSDWINTNNDKSILLRITDSSGQKVQLLYSTDGTTNIIYTSTSSISNSTWTHVAVCKDSTSLRLYIDGVEEIWENNPSFTLNPNAGTIGPLIGGNYDKALTSYGQFFDGYIQDLRVTKGLARYNANFTPPTAPLEG